MTNLTEASAKRSKLMAGVGGGALLLVVLIYFGLSALASSKAEERLKGQLIEMGHPYAVQWKKLSASPLGGTIKLEDVQLNVEIENRWSGNMFYRASADSVTLKGFNSKGAPSKAEILLEAVEFPSIPQGRGERNMLLSLINESGAINLFRQSGRSELSPLTLQASWNSKKDSLSMEWRLDLDEMFSAKGTQNLEGPLGRVLAELDMEQLTVRPLESLAEVAMHASQVGISRFDLQVRDLGMMKRINLLEQRYMVASREVNKTGAAEERLFDQAQTSCTADFSEVFTNNDACKRFAEFASAQRNTLELKASGKDPLRFADFQRGGEALLKLRLQPELR